MANPKIQLRHDTAANWTSVNPVLLEGEVGIETDTRKQKFGDGVTAWNSLPYDTGSTALQSDSIVTPLSYRASGISTTVIGSIDSDGYLNGTTSSVEAEFVPETTIASQIIFNDVFSFNSHSAWTNDAMLDVVFSEPFTVGNTTSDTLSLYVTRYGTIYFIIGDDDYIYSAELIGGSGTYDSEINLVLTFTDSGDNWTIGTGVTNFDGSTWKYGNSSGTCIFSRMGTNTATIPKTAKIKEFVLYNSAQSRMDTINTSVQIGTTVYTINSDSAGLKLSYNSDNLKVNNNNQLDTVVELSELATQNWVTNQGYLTAITSSNVTNALGYTPVNKAGDTMSGTLTTTKLNVSNMNQGAISLKNITNGGFSDVTFYDDNDNRIGFVRGNNVSSTVNNTQISVVDKNNTVGGTLILTNDNGTNSASLNTTLTANNLISNGSLTTAGNINLGGNGRMNLKVNGTSKGTTPSSNSYQAFLFNDNDSSHTTWQSQRFGACEMQVLNTGENRLILSAYKNEADATWGGTLTLGVPANGSAYCTFPNTKCCDGQWVHSQLIAGTSVAKGIYNVSLSSYLPNDGHMYEVMINLRVYSSNSSNAGEVFVYSDVFSETQYNSVNISGQGGAGGNSRQIGNTFILPVGTQRTITYKIESYAVTNLNLVLWGYRRIGTNA